MPTSPRFRKIIRQVNRQRNTAEFLHHFLLLVNAKAVTNWENPFHFAGMVVAIGDFDDLALHAIAG